MITRSNDFVRSPSTTHPGIRLALIAVAAVAVYACDRVTGPSASPHDYWGRVLPVVGVTPGVTTLCQIGLGARYDVRIAAMGSTGDPQNVSVADGQCQVVANVDPARQDDVIVRIEVKEAMYYALDHIMFQHGEETPRLMTGSNSVSFEGTHGALVTFFNNAAINVCELGVSSSATFQYQIGLDNEFKTLTLSDGQCSRIATLRPASADDMIVTVRQGAVPQGSLLEALTFAHGDGAARTLAAGTSSISFEGLHGGLVTFKHVRAP